MKKATKKLVPVTVHIYRFTTEYNNNKRTEIRALETSKTLNPREVFDALGLYRFAFPSSTILVNYQYFSFTEKSANFKKWLIVKEKAFYDNMGGGYYYLNQAQFDQINNGLSGTKPTRQINPINKLKKPGDEVILSLEKLRTIDYVFYSRAKEIPIGKSTGLTFNSIIYSLKNEGDGRFRLMYNYKDTSLPVDAIPVIGDDVRGFGHQYGTPVISVSVSGKKFQIKEGDYLDSGNKWVSFDDVELITYDPENLPWSCKQSDPDWTWAFKDKEKRKSEKKSDITINTGVPLAFIKRIGGIQIAEVSEKEILDKLGFSGVTLGNYVKDVEAREHIRHFLGAIADLCEVLNFDTKTINKGLSIGFGAYGRGGKAMATYYPTLQAINLTKRRGDGTVCHEWGHYLDNYLFSFNKNGYFRSRWAIDELASSFGYAQRHTTSRGRSSLHTDSVVRYIQGCANKHQSDMVFVRMILLFGFIRYGVEVFLADEGGAYNDFSPEYKNYSNYYIKSKEVGSVYWIEPWELFARAFEVYIFDKLAAAGRENNYLVSGSYFNHLVYPQGDERKAVTRLFDNLIEAIRKADEIPAFKPWTTIRNDEYIVLDENKTDEEVTTGLIVESEQSDKKEPDYEPQEGREVAFHDLKEGQFVEVWTAGVLVDHGIITFKYGLHYVELDNDSKRKYKYNSAFKVIDKPGNSELELLEIEAEAEQELLILLSKKNA